MVGCAAVFCRNWPQKSRPRGITFHTFPMSKPDMVEKWLVNIKRDNWSPNKRSLLCSDHFEEICFDRTGQTVRIRSGAVPTKFKFPDHLMKENGTKKPRKRINASAVKRGSDESLPSEPTDVLQAVLTHAENNARVSPKLESINHDESLPLNPADVLEVVLTSIDAPDDSQHGFCESPITLKHRLEEEKKKNEKTRKKLKMSQQNVRRLKKQVRSLTELTDYLRKELSLAEYGKDTF